MAWRGKEIPGKTALRYLCLLTLTKVATFQCLEGGQSPGKCFGSRAWLCKSRKMTEKAQGGTL